MAWSVDQIYKAVLFQIRKNQSGSLSAGEFFFTWNMEQSSYQTDLIGRYQKKTNSKQGINTGLIENEVTMTKLSPFTKTTTIPITAGKATKPVGTIYNMALKINGAKVYQVNPNQKWSVIDDVIDPPDIPENSYYYTEYEDYYSILPAGATSLELDYILTATDVVWGFDLVAGRQQYNAGNSTQPLWDQASIIEITQACLKTLGVSYSSQDFEQYGESKIQNGR